MVQLFQILVRGCSITCNTFGGGGGFVPSHMGGQVQRDKALKGGIMRGDIDLMGGLTLTDYIIN